ncbi:MAG: hypothetical protein IPO91_09980 [Chloroflexi bacterium]|nr:hypothetical protein [Chloroflexota bacterium]
MQLYNYVGSTMFSIRRFLLLIVLIALSACAGAGASVTVTPTVEDSQAQAVTAEALPPPQLLAWVDIQGGRDAHTGGQIALIEADGTISPVLPLAATDSLVVPCGQSGDTVAVYAGGASGSLYLLNGTQISAALATTYNLACFDDGTFQFAPDGSRLAYLDYNPSAFTKEYADGVLHVLDTASLGAVASFDDVTTYVLEDNRAVFVRFYQNARGEAVEAAILLWDGTDNREILTLTPTGETCRFTSAALALHGDQAAVVLGQRCTNQGTDWQLYTVDLNERMGTLAASADTGGVYLPYARTNNIWLSPNGTYAYITVPDGVTSRTASLVLVNLTDYSVLTLIDRQVLLPHHEDPRRVRVQSPDGAWLALPITSPGNNRNGLTVIELNDPSMPVRLDLALDTIGGIAFAPNNVVYAEINANGDGSLNALDLTAGTTRRVLRGNFQDGLLITPDGSGVVAQLYAGDAPYYSDLVGVMLGDGVLSPLYTGNPANRAQPLAWVTP